MNRPVHFEMHGNNPEAMMRFYQTAFGWQFNQFPGAEYWLANTGDPAKPGINGGIMRSKDGNARTINTIQVESVDEAIKKVTAAGGKMVHEKMAIPGVGWLAYFTDPSGNIVGVTHFDSNAK